MEKAKIKDSLLAEAVQTPDTVRGLNDARDAMRNTIEAKLRSLMWWGLSDTYWKPWTFSRAAWSGIMKEDDSPQDNFQVHICKWSDIRDGAAPPRLRYQQNIRKVKDSGGGLRIGKRQEYPNDSTLNRVVNAYLYRLFRADDAPLTSMATFLDEIEADYATHRVVVSVDFYYSRPLTQLGLHKDTTGNTLFVGLHYDNDEAMLGPEYLYDFWPMKLAEDRYHSPWSSDQGVPYWPKDLVDGLELARLRLKEDHWKNRDLLLDSTMARNGLITFVDELIFHVTPLTRKRTEDEKTEGNALFRAVNINSVLYQIKDLVQKKTPKLRRALSAKDLLDVRGTGGNGRRSFIRFWVMVEPKRWHVGG